MTKQDVTYQDKLNELRLDVSHPNSTGVTYILVEGDSDIRLFRKFFNVNYCKVEAVPGGKFKLEECVQELLKIYLLVIGIRDADFIHLGIIPYTKPNMFLTDYHDLEMTLIAEEEVFSALMYEYTDIKKSDHLLFKNKIFKSLEDISYLKWLNELEQLELSFDVGFQDLISPITTEIDFSKYFNRIIAKSPNAKITDIITINKKIDVLKNENPDVFQLTNGHDFMKAFSQYIKYEGKVKSTNDETISRTFRITYRGEFLIKTSLYSITKAWETAHRCCIYS